jgi:hypothetical protein
MKKTLLTSTFMLAGTIGLLAQGLVTFDNNPYLFFDSIEFGGSVDYKIYASEGVAVDDASWTAALFQGGTQLGERIPFDPTFPGVLNLAVDANGGSRTLNTAGGLGTTLEVRVFDGSGAFLGASDPFAYNAPAAPTNPPEDFYISNFRGFVVPEPSTIALGVLGLGALLVFRRRK